MGFGLKMVKNCGIPTRELGGLEILRLSRWFVLLGSVDRMGFEPSGVMLCLIRCGLRTFDGSRAVVTVLAVFVLGSSGIRAFSGLLSRFLAIHLLFEAA
jgi:hypothetical protein